MYFYSSPSKRDKYRGDARCSLGTSDSSENWCTESLWNVVLKIRKFIDGAPIFRYEHSRFLIQWIRYLIHWIRYLKVFSTCFVISTTTSCFSWKIFSLRWTSKHRAFKCTKNYWKQRIMQDFVFENVWESNVTKIWSTSKTVRWKPLKGSAR